MEVYLKRAVSGIWIFINEYVIGVYIDENLNWSHINDMCQNIAYRLGICKSVSRKLNIRTAKLMYNSLVWPHFDYCNSIVNNSHTTFLDILHKLQNRGCWNYNVGTLQIQCPTYTRYSYCGL